MKDWMRIERWSSQWIDGRAGQWRNDGSQSRVDMDGGGLKERAERNPRASRVVGWNMLVSR